VLSPEPSAPRERRRRRIFALWSFPTDQDAISFDWMCELGCNGTPWGAGGPTLRPPTLATSGERVAFEPPMSPEEARLRRFSAHARPSVCQLSEVYQWSPVLSALDAPATLTSRDEDRSRCHCQCRTAMLMIRLTSAASKGFGSTSYAPKLSASAQNRSSAWREVTIRGGGFGIAAISGIRSIQP
jgi:hypothetical protein